MDFEIVTPNGIYPNYWTIGNQELYIPNPSSRSTLRVEIEEHLRSVYQPGIYTGNEANEISKHLFNFYHSELKKTITLIDDPFFIYFTLFNFDKATKINYQFKNNKLSKSDSLEWKTRGPLYRRTLSYLLDEMVSNFNFPTKSEQSFMQSMIEFDRIFLLVEKSINYSIVSNEIYYLNESYKVKINSSGSELFIESLDTKESLLFKKLHEYYYKQTALDATLKSKYLEGRAYEDDWVKHGEFLNEAFKNTLEISYSELMFVLTSIILNTKEIEDEKDIPLVKKNDLIHNIAEQIKRPEKKIQDILDGLILKKSHFVQNKRTFQKYKQLYRVGKRPFIEIEKPDGKYLTWSNEMLKERLNFLDNDFIFKTLPTEWVNGKTLLSVDRISNDAGRWFENQVKQNFLKRGIVGDKIKDKILPGKKSLNCGLVGGFDFIGYSQKDNLIILVECKFINPGFEPRSYYDDIDSFTNSRNGFVKKLDKKVEWLLSNFNEVKREIEIRYCITIPQTCINIGTAFMTYVNTFAFAFIQKYPCVSLTEFFHNYDKKKKWYLKKGIINTYA
jgi:hypothetical protein